MPRLIDAEHLKKRATDWEGDCWDNYAQSTEDFLEYIDNEPTVDAVEIVRCKDCRWCHAGYCEMADDLIPWGFDHYEWENFYCAWAERREDVS